MPETPSAPQFLRELDERGAITYRPPSPMRVGERYEVEARIAAGVDEPGGVPAEEFTGGLPGEGPPTMDVLPVGPRMVVELLSPGDVFDIDPITPAEQSVRERTVTRWEWSVSPRRAGRHVLKLTATAVIGEDRTPYRVYDAEILVEANRGFTFRTFFAQNWQEVLATVVALGGLIVTVLKLAQDSKQHSSEQRETKGKTKRPGSKASHSRHH